MSFHVPILFMIFNRPAATRRVFEAIKKAQPSKLFIAADGPRAGRDGERDQCDKARRIVEEIDWPCIRKTLYRESNLGCRRAVRSAITWFLDSAGEGIIIEDDCLPDASFFPFCEELLGRYRTEPRVGAISGSNLWGGFEGRSVSYSFSRHASIWGWATWKRSWDLAQDIYDRVERGDETLSEVRHAVSDNPAYGESFWRQAREVLTGLDTWDYQWCMAMYTHRMLIARPAMNLVANIGYGADATHTKANPRKGVLESHAMPFPLVHPESVAADPAADGPLEKSWLGPARRPGIARRVLRRAKSAVGRILSR